MSSEEITQPDSPAGTTTAPGMRPWGVGDLILGLYEVTEVLGEGGM